MSAAGIETRPRGGGGGDTARIRAWIPFMKREWAAHPDYDIHFTGGENECGEWTLRVLSVRPKVPALRTGDAGRRPELEYRHRLLARDRASIEASRRRRPPERVTSSSYSPWLAIL